MTGNLYVQSLNWASFRIRTTLGLQETYRLIEESEFPDDPDDPDAVRTAMSRTRSQVIGLLNGFGVPLLTGIKATIVGRIETLTLTAPMEYLVYSSISREDA